MEKTADATCWQQTPTEPLHGRRGGRMASFTPPETPALSQIRRPTAEPFRAPELAAGGRVG
eukprot:scaffold1600_cov120-Isochrysis_galbana.AAC.3